jgi:hypothetical protein
MKMKDEGERLREYTRSFLNALRPIIVAATGSSVEIELARIFLSGQSATSIYTAYHKHMDMELNGKPVWKWIAVRNEDVLTARPELLLGMDNKQVKDTAQKWISILSPEQKNTVWQWLHGMLVLAGYDVSQALDEHSV